MTGNSRRDVSTGDGSSELTPNELVLAGLSEQLIDLKTVQPDADLRDESELRDILADRRIVGLGEATHGAMEFTRLKHRLVRYLVEELDFRWFALEANLTLTLALDRYVSRGTGDPATALRKLNVWPWKTEEMLALVKWVRAFNRDRTPKDRVRFFGLDAQHSKSVADAVAEYIDRVDPAYHATIDQDLGVLADPGLRLAKSEGRQDRIAAGERVVADLRETFDERRDDYVSRSSDGAWKMARQQVTVLRQAVELARAAHSGDELIDENVIRIRDRAMAENVEWSLKDGSADRLVVWAHNDHVNRVATRASGHRAESMGNHLARWYDEDYYALGFEFGRGTFQAGVHDEDEGWVYNIQECTLNEPIANTVAATFSDLDHRIALLDLRTATDDPRLQDWLDGERRLHSVGNAFDPGRPGKHFQGYMLPDAFDGVCYVDETSGTRLLRSD